MEPARPVDASDVFEYDRCGYLGNRECHRTVRLLESDGRRPLERHGRREQDGVLSQLAVDAADRFRSCERDVARGPLSSTYLQNLALRTSQGNDTMAGLDQLINYVPTDEAA